MMEKRSNFATYSRPLCWIVAIIAVLVAIMTFIGDAENAAVRGFLWLALAVVFTISAMLLSRSKQAGSADNSESTGE